MQRFLPRLVVAQFQPRAAFAHAQPGKTIAGMVLPLAHLAAQQLGGWRLLRRGAGRGVDAEYLRRGEFLGVGDGKGPGRIERRAVDGMQAQAGALAIGAPDLGADMAGAVLVAGKEDDAAGALALPRRV